MASFITANNTALTGLPPLRTKHANLTPAERDALKNLVSNQNIVIKPADKGSGVVISNTNDYIHEAFRQLSDTSFYKPLEDNCISHISVDITKTLTLMRNNKEIDKNVLRTSYQTIHVQDDFISYQKYARASFPHQAALLFRQLAAPPKKSQNF